MHFRQTLSSICQSLFLDTHSKKLMKSPRNPFSIGNIKVSSVVLSYTHTTGFKPMPLHLAFDWCVSLGFCWSGQVLLNRSFCARYIHTYGKLTWLCFKHLPLWWHGCYVPVGCGVWPGNRPDEAALSEPSKEPYSCWNTGKSTVHTHTT